jgi:hypothetical protein
MRRWIAALAAAGMVATAACGGAEEGGSEPGMAGGPTADTVVAEGAMGGDTAAPPAAGH